MQTVRSRFENRGGVAVAAVLGGILGAFVMQRSSVSQEPQKEIVLSGDTGETIIRGGSIEIRSADKTRRTWIRPESVTIGDENGVRLQLRVNTDGCASLILFAEGGIDDLAERIFGSMAKKDAGVPKAGFMALGCFPEVYVDHRELRPKLWAQSLTQIRGGKDNSYQEAGRTTVVFRPDNLEMSGGAKRFGLSLVEPEVYIDGVEYIKHRSTPPPAPRPGSPPPPAAQAPKGLGMLVVFTSGTARVGGSVTVKNNATGKVVVKQLEADVNERYCAITLGQACGEAGLKWEPAADGKGVKVFGSGNEVTAVGAELKKTDTKD